MFYRGNRESSRVNNIPGIVKNKTIKHVKWYDIYKVSLKKINHIHKS